jgi:dTDP-4-amino-4,6-dideoxygalactose transaminase
MRTDRQFAHHRDKILSAILPILECGTVLQGSPVLEFEGRIATTTGIPHVISCSSGTDALILAMTALELPEGSRVAVPAFTFVATASPVLHARCVPVFVDCDENSGMPNEDLLVELIERREIDAIVIVHLYGQLMKAERLALAARKAVIPVIEDAAQALGALRNGKTFGQVGKVSTLSFDPMKVLGALGSGGAVLTHDDALATRIRQLRLHGYDGRGSFLAPGFNSQLPTIQAAALLAKSELLEEWQERRAEIAAIYDAALPNSDSVERIPTLSGNVHNWHKYVLRLKTRDQVLRRLSSHGIQCKIHYEIPLHRQPLFQKYAQGVQCKNSEMTASQVLSLPIYPELTDQELTRITNALRQVFSEV